MAPPALAPPADPLRHAYLEDARVRGCSREGLIFVIKGDSASRIRWIWDPGSPRWVCAEEVSWLVEAVQSRERLRLEQGRDEAARTSLWLLLAVVLGAVAGGTSGAAQGAWLLAMLGIAPLLDHSWDLYRLRSSGAESSAQSALHARYLTWLEHQTGTWTGALGVGIGLVAAVQLAVAVIDGSRSSILAAGVVKAAVRNGEWWRLLTGTLLHGSVLHLLFNGLSLWGLGKVVEVTFGWAYLPLTFVLGAVAGSICSLILLPDTTSVGASGGILALLGFVLASAWSQRSAIPLFLYRGLLRSVVYCAIGGVVAYRSSTTPVISVAWRPGWLWRSCSRGSGRPAWELGSARP